MPNCSFCDGPILKGTGLIYVKKDGTIYNFCSSKCRKNNLDLGREGRRQKWTPAARKFLEREAAKKAEAKASKKA
ncbi:MAG: 50S ribosomal protein L24e [Candidatus Micrarchaeota archaeon]